MSGSKDDINVRAAYQHMAADAAISLGVVIVRRHHRCHRLGLARPGRQPGHRRLIAWSTWAVLRESLRMVLAAVPSNVDPARVDAFLGQLPGVSGTHDLHIWAMSTTETALTAHLVMPEGYPGDAAIDAIVARLKAEFSIHHCTLQIEEGTTDHACCLQEPPMLDLHAHHAH